MVLQPFAWEEVLDMITRSGIEREAKNGLSASWICGMNKVIADQEIGIKKALDQDMTSDDLANIFDHTGYSVCRKCSKVVEEDHKHLWESSG